MPHDVRGQVDERTSTFFQINSLNSQFVFHKIATARFHDLYRAQISSLSWLPNVKEGSYRGKRKAHKLWIYWPFWTAWAYKGLDGFGQFVQWRVNKFSHPHFLPPSGTVSSLLARWCGKQTVTHDLISVIDSYCNPPNPVTCETACSPRHLPWRTPKMQFRIKATDGDRETSM